jgi:hypothetical protein
VGDFSPYRPHKYTTVYWASVGHASTSTVARQQLCRYIKLMVTDRPVAPEEIAALPEK